VLLHGLGATGEAFRPLLDLAASTGTGTCTAVDLPGHGRSPALEEYSVETTCRALAQALPRVLDGAVVVGHSLGGVLALALASGRFGPRPSGAVVLSVKTTWSAADIARTAALAERPRARFDTEEAAGERFLKVAGLWGVADWPELRRSGTARDGDGWVLAQDPRTNRVEPPDLAPMLAASGCPVVVATGARDPMAPLEQLRTSAPDARCIEGAGHAVHAEDPAAVLALAADVAGAG
jgi:pimeloyl-ACP methyl ester carboxylesterase